MILGFEVGSWKGRIVNESEKGLKGVKLEVGSWELEETSVAS